jgi:hypothetical protein
MATPNRTVTATAPAAAAPKAPRSYSTTLGAADGTTTLRLMALRRSDGSAITFAIHTTVDGKKRKHTRGATETHASLDRAKVAMEKLAVTAIKAGWIRKERTGGFVRKPDSFDAAHLPAPGKKGAR